MQASAPDYFYFVLVMIVVVFPLLVTVVVETDDVIVEVLDKPFEDALPPTVTDIVVSPSSETILF